MRIFPLGESALTVEFGNEISLDMNARAITLAKHIQNDPFPGFIECVPAYASTTVFYQPAMVRSSFPADACAFDAVRNRIEQLIEGLRTETGSEHRKVELPVSFDARSALDLPYVCEHSGLEEHTVLDIFLERTYTVFMLGFLPGFAYMGEVDERIATPRNTTPRTKVPKGSVGIAGRQTGIYPLESPGGWQIIGRTEAKLFAPDADKPCLLKPGDRVKFVRV